MFQHRTPTTPTLLLALLLSPLALALPPLGHEVPGDADAPAGWSVDAGEGAATHELGEARLLTRGGRLVGVTGTVRGGSDGAAALAALLAAARGGGEDLARDLEHYLTSGEAQAFTRVDNALLSLRESFEGVEFDFSLIQLAPGDFRRARHALNPDGAVPVRVYGDVAAPETAAFLTGVFPQLAARAGEAGVRVEYHHAPVSGAGAGVLAAEASECVAAGNPAGGFWPYLELLARERSAWVSMPSPQAYFAEAARRLGLDAPGVSGCIAERLALREIAAAREAAENLGLAARPTVFVGGFLMTDASDMRELARLAALAGTVADEPAASEGGEADALPLDPIGEGDPAD